MRRALAATAAYLGACAVFTALMGFTTPGREQEAWTLAAILLAAPALAVATAWAMQLRRPE